ncbi:MAG: porin [Bacteroidota bacterium]
MRTRWGTMAVMRVAVPLLALAVQPLAAQDPTPTHEQAEPPPVNISGFVDTYFNWNFERPTTHTNRLRNFDITENQFVVSAAELDVQRPAAPIGFRIDANYGAATDIIHSGSPGTLNTFQQAYLTVVVPVGAGVTVDAGKFVTHMGYETIKSKDNANYSRSFLFAWAIPYYHLGVRASYPVADNVTIGASVCNGWNASALNSHKTIGAMVTYAPVPSLSLAAGWIGGPQQPDTLGNDSRHVIEAIVGFQANDRLSFAVDGNYGTEPVGGATMVWKGVAVYGRYLFSEASTFAARAEVYSDPEGYTTGLTQELKEITLTFEYRLVANLALRAEFRHDWSSAPAFDGKNGSGTMTHQSTLGIGSIITF